MFASRQRELFSIQFLQIVDGFLVWLAFFISSKLRVPMMDMVGEYREEISLYEITWLLMVVVPFTPLVLEMFGFYRSPLHKKLSQSAWQLFRGVMVIALLVAVSVIFFKLSVQSRFVLGLAMIFTFIFLLIREEIVRLKVKERAGKPENRERILVAGRPKDVKEILEEMPAEVTSYWQVMAEVDLSQVTPEEFDAILIEHSIERVIIAAKHAVFREISRAVELCEAQGIEAWISAGFIRTQVARPTFDNLGGKPMLVLRSTPELSWALMCKEVMDRVGAFCMIAATSPLWLVAYIGIKKQSPGPVFFKQDRAGRYGKTFKMWKFRTMVTNAEELLADVKKDQGNEMSGPVFKLENDPRVFPFARFLRKTSIDELPQLINVLKGDMSLVGPRPLPVYEVKEFEKSEHRRRLSVKPGITCTWQAGGRNTITEWEDWVKMDLEYIDNWSLGLDIKLLLMTIPAVLFSKGAK